jgi:tetratricopeptide (TPR) repeat protein
VTKIYAVFAGALLMISVGSANAQESARKGASGAADPNVAANHALDLAEKGHCREALPGLRRALAQTSDKDLKFDLGASAARCGMSLNDIGATADALAFLNREFPQDPRVLYLTTHYFSELANRASQELAATAPQSKEAMELDAEGHESQGKWDEAIAEYKSILEKDPKTPGIHYRLGRIILSEPPTATSIEDAEKEFEAELALHPQDAPSEFMLGEIARQAQQWPDAVEHFSRAKQIDAGFSDAYIGLGMSLNALQKYQNAIPVLEAYVKMEPSDPAGHYQLAIAYGRSGREKDASREMALQQEAEKAQKGTAPPQ